MAIGEQVFGIWVRLWAQEKPTLMNQVLENPQLFNGYAETIQEINHAMVPGGRFADVVANLRLRGRHEIAEELAALGHSEGSSNAWVLTRGLDELIMPQVCGRLESVLMRRASDPAIGGSVFHLKAAIEEILRPLEEVYPAPGAEPVDPTIDMGDRDMEPEVTTPEAIISQLIFPGLSFLSGPWKTAYKTTLALALTFAIHNGMPFLGRQTRRMRVGWVQRDMDISQFLLLGRGLRDGMGFPERGGIKVLTRPLDLTEIADQEYLSAWVKRYKIELLVIDSFSAVFGGGDENDATAMRAVLRRYLIDQVRDGLGCSILVVAHPSRHSGSVIRGSGDSEAAADSLLKARPRMDGERVKHVELYGRGRHPEVELGYAVDHLETSGGGVRIREVKTERRIQDDELILEELESAEEEWLSTTAVNEAIKRSYGATKTALSRLLAQGKVEVRENPHARGQQWKKHRQEPD